MEPSAYIDHVSREGERVKAVAAPNMAASVPGCPDWQVRDLVAHLGGIYLWVTAAVRGAGERPPRDSGPAPTDDAELLDWFDAAHRELVDDLGSRRAEDPAWTFVSAGPQTVGWWCRRQAHETVVHRYDAEAAAGAPAPIDPELAADGVDEYLSLFLARALARRSVEGLHGSLHLHATDTPGEWWMNLDGPDPGLRHEHAKADTAVRGPAGGLILWLWNRVDPAGAGLEVFGDQGVVAAFARLSV